MSSSWYPSTSITMFSVKYIPYNVTQNNSLTNHFLFITHSAMASPYRFSLWNTPKDSLKENSACRLIYGMGLCEPYSESLPLYPSSLRNSRDYYARVVSVISMEILICHHRIHGLYSLSGKTSYRNISWSLEAARFGLRFFPSLWNLTGTWAAALPRWPVTRSFDVFFDLHLNKRLSKHRDAGDLRRHRGHYDVNVMNDTIIITHNVAVSRFHEIWR